MTKDKKKKKDVKNDSLLVTDEKWRGLENKFWTVVEFGYYTILVLCFDCFNTILDNGYVATFTIGDINSINYYSSNGELIKTFATKLNSSGRLDSNTGVYAVCNSKKLEIAKYTIKDDGEFVEELMGNYNSDQC